MSNKEQYVAMPASVFNDVINTVSELPYARVSQVMDQVKQTAKVLNMPEEPSQEQMAVQRNEPQVDGSDDD